VTKPFSPRELVARVRATLRLASGEMGPETIVRAGDVELDLAALTATVAGQAVDLEVVLEVDTSDELPHSP
jgi:two-component system OmpR family response regulator